MAETCFIVKAGCDHTSKCVRKAFIICFIRGFQKILCSFFVKVIRSKHPLPLIELCLYSGLKHNGVPVPADLKVIFRQVEQASAFVIGLELPDIQWFHCLCIIAEEVVDTSSALPIPDRIIRCCFPCPADILRLSAESDSGPHMKHLDG